MSRTQTFASGIVGGLTAGIATALLVHFRDERKFEPSIKEKAQALDVKWVKDGAELAGNLESAKRDAQALVNEKSNIQ